MEFKLPIDDIKHELVEIYESDAFPIWCIGGSVLLVGLTNDMLWLLIGIAGFLWALFKRG